MKEFVKFAMFAILFAGLLGIGQVNAQLTFKAAPAAGQLPAHGGGGWAGGGGWYGGGFGGYGGYGGFGLRNPYNPFSPYSPYNPLSPYSPYNPISPYSPYYNPYYAPYYTSTYLYNPIYNPGLLSRNPAVQMQAWGWANMASTNVYAYSNYYAATLQNQQAYVNNYNTALYQQAAMQQYVNAANLSTQAAYTAMAAQQYQNKVADPYAVQAHPSAPQQSAPVQPAPQQQQHRYQTGFNGSAATNQPQSYDPFISASPGQSFGQKATGFDAQIKVAQPSYNEVQAKIMADRLARIQMNSSPGEIISGVAQNVLLDDIRKYVALPKASMPDLKLPEDTLKEINVIRNGGSLGVIRNDGKITWPVALSSYVLTPAEQSTLQKTVSGVIASAVKNKVDGGAIISMGQQINDITDKLIKKINDIPTNDYLEAKRFLNDFDQARLALQKNEWTYHMQYQSFIAEGKGNGRSVQDLAKFMIDSGFKFAGATSQDEGSYKALYSALVAYDVQLNAQYAPQQLVER